MKLFLALSFLAFFSSGARAACPVLSISRSASTVDFRQDPNPTSEIRVSGVGACEFFLTVDNGGAGSFQARSLRRSTGDGALPFSLCLDSACSRPWKDLSEASSGADVLASGILGLGEVRLNYYPRLGGDPANAPWGDYAGSYTVRLYEGNVNGLRVLRDTVSLRFSTRVEKQIDLSLVNTGFPFDASSTTKTMDFGLLSTGKEMGFDLLLRYNAGYLLRFSSANGGALKHDSLNVKIPYTISLNGAPLSFAGSGSPVTVSQGAGSSPAAGLRFPGRVQIGDVSGARAGSYGDVVTITVSTTE